MSEIIIIQPDGDNWYPPTSGGGSTGPTGPTPPSSTGPTGPTGPQIGRAHV